jgi:signal transduction histidine kinase
VASAKTIPARYRIGLRGRVLLTFGLLSSLVAAALAVVGWLIVSTFLVGQRTRSAYRIASGHAAIVDGALAQPGPDVPAILDSLTTAPTDQAVLRYDGQWYGGVSDPGGAGLPHELTTLVESGTAATQRIGEGADLVLAVGVPLPRSGGSFFQLVRLDELSRTLELVSISLVVAVLLLGVVNTATGWFASKIALRPLTRLTEVASAVAAGRLDARMETDDPDLRDLALSFNDTVDTLERRVAADARFAGDVGHELRTPLTTMINSMALVQNRRAELPRAVLEPLDLLADDLARFRGLVIDLIEISRHDSGAAAHVEQVDIADLVRRAADTAAGRPVTEVSDSIAGTIVWADKRRLERVVANLVENAEGHGGRCSGVQVTRDGDRVVVTVDDEGPGVPIERRERIFERFARMGGSGDDGTGVGLGLAIVARHVQAHGGIVRVEDGPRGGARFVVSLPLHRGDTR